MFELFASDSKNIYNQSDHESSSESVSVLESDS
jgi:hypothetical protein